MADYLSELRRFFEEEIRFNQAMGLRVEHLETGLARMRLPYREDFVGDPYRPALHGGVLSFLIDVCGGLAVFTRLTPGGKCSTIDLRVDYYRPADRRDLLATGRVVSFGNRIAVSNVEVIHEGDAEVLAEGRAAYNLRKP